MPRWPVNYVPPAEKACIRCKVVLPLTFFTVARKTRDGRTADCAACNRAYMRSYYANNFSTAVRAANSTQVAKRLASKKRWESENKDRWFSQIQKWKQDNAAKEAERQRRWAADNPGRRTATQAKRRATLLRAIPKWADHGAIMQIYAFARELSASTGQAQHVDHIIPLQGKTVCGLHCEANLRVVSASVNLSKGAKFMMELMR